LAALTLPPNVIRSQGQPPNYRPPMGPRVTITLSIRALAERSHKLSDVLPILADQASNVACDLQLLAATVLSKNYQRLRSQRDRIILARWLDTNPSQRIQDASIARKHKPTSLRRSPC